MKKILHTCIEKIRANVLPNSELFQVKLPYILTALVALIVVIIGVNLFVELTSEVRDNTVSVYDQNVTDYIISFRNPALTQYFKFVTNIGDVKGYLVILGLSIFLTIFVFKRWKYILQIVIVLALSAVSNMILKRFIDRARPGIEHLVVVKTLSYPSGHAMSAMAFYGFLIYLLYTFRLNKALKTLLILVLIILILSIGISRIYLGVHFPSDIAGGYIAGLIWVFFCVFLFELIEVFKRDPKT